MALADYYLEEHIAVITMNSGDNRFNPIFIDSMLNVLDDVEKQTDARTLIVKSGHEKIFSNGIDTDWLLPVLRGRHLLASPAVIPFAAMRDLPTQVVAVALLLLSTWGLIVWRKARPDGPAVALYLGGVALLLLSFVGTGTPGLEQLHPGRFRGSFSSTGVTVGWCSTICG